MSETSNPTSKANGKKVIVVGAGLAAWLQRAVCTKPVMRCRYSKRASALAGVRIPAIIGGHAAGLGCVVDTRRSRQSDHGFGETNTGKTISTSVEVRGFLCQGCGATNDDHYDAAEELIEMAIDAAREADDDVSIRAAVNAYLSNKRITLRWRSKLSFAQLHIEQEYSGSVEQLSHNILTKISRSVARMWCLNRAIKPSCSICRKV